MDADREARIREEVRLQIEERERARREEEERRRRDERQHDEERRRQRILEEETRDYYRNSPDYIEYINEHGESEWLTRKQILAREGYFDYEENVDNPDLGRRRVWIGLAAVGAVVLALLLAGWLYWVEETGAVTVVCNVPGSAVFVDGQDTGETTDARLELPAGEHLIEVRRDGWRSQGGDYRALRLKRGDEQHLLFELTPVR